MLYPVVRPLAAVAIKVFFRKIHLSGAECIPRNEPVILAANHPTAFMEPCILACYLDRPLYYLVRGDFFVKPLYATLLRDLHMLPVYRMKDRGYKFLKENYATFAACSEALKENKTIMILVEGRTIHEKRLRPIQKGMARIAFGTLERFPDMDLKIVPVGVNYTYADRWRSEVMIHFGEPVRVQDFWSSYQENPTAGVNDLTDIVRQELEKKVIVIEKPEDELLTEHLLVLDRTARPEPVLPVLDRSDAPRQAEKAVADRVNRLSEQEKAVLLKKTKAYFDRLEACGVEDAALAGKNVYSPLNSLRLFLGFIPFLLGYVLNFLPLRLARQIADKKIRHIEFYSPVLVAVGLGAYLIYGIILVIYALVIGHPAFWAVIVATPFLGVLALFYRDLFLRWRAGRKAAGLSPEKRAELLGLRGEIVEQFAEVEN